MRVLLSAYAFNNVRGSEPHVGWCWAMELLNMGHEVWVITRANNRQAVEESMAQDPNQDFSRLHVHYFDFPPWARWWKKGNYGVHLYYFLWQLGIVGLAKQLHQANRFDRVHHVTFVSVRQPSFLWCLGVPFTFGPVAGGEKAPWALRKSYPLRGWLIDFVRDVQTAFIPIDPFMQLTFAKAHRIYVTSSDTQALIPRRHHHKTQVMLAIGLKPDELPKPQARSSAATCRILYTGRLVYLKGLHFALHSLAALKQQHPNINFTLIGNGPEASWLKAMSHTLGLDDCVTWIPEVPRQELLTMYNQYDIFCFPSLHDTGGAVVLEAMAHGLPTVCLDLGGPGVIVDDTSGMVIKTQGQSEAAIIDAFTQALNTLITDVATYQKQSQGAYQRINQFLWPEKARHVYPSDS